ncbi:hypothetical protein [Jatrophihabitans sp.]|uniref:hypothetical protein n=1 Tax=Jatrophihabitans sp. TaxID=1932789 RepID=UPI002CCCA278|nr:hypothetical protein [Jatrophihabitans sp.]
MTDLDTTIKELVNSAVDAELAGHRMVPEFDRLALIERSRPAGGLRQWALPVLAASLAALLAAGMILAITMNREPGLRRAHVPATPSPSRSALPTASFPEARGVPEAEDVAGVTVVPATADDAILYGDPQDYYYFSPTIAEYPSPEPAPGEPFEFTVKYIAGRNAPEVAVFSSELRGVSTGACPGPFLARSVHTYLLHCRAVYRPGGDGQLVISYHAAGSEGGLALPLQGFSVARDRAATRFAEATAGVPEATEVTGVAVGPASAEHPGYTGLGGPARELAGTTVVPGRSYPFTVDYIVASDGDPVAILSVTLGDVATGRCPNPFLVRAGHTYRISCQVTFRTPQAGQLEIASQSVIGRQTQTSPLLEPNP